MKRVVQFLLVVSLTVSALALWGLVRIWIPYSIGEAFNNSGLIRTQENFAAERQIHLWAGYFFVGVIIALALLSMYRKSHRHERK